MPAKKYATNFKEFVDMYRLRIYDLLSDKYPYLLKNPPINPTPNNYKYEPITNTFEKLGLTVPEDFPYNERSRFGALPAQPYFESLMGEPLHMYDNGGNLKNLI